MLRLNTYISILLRIKRVLESYYPFFISVFNQLDAQNVFHNKFYFMPLHVSSTCAHHQEVKIALHSLWYHHTYRWQSRARVERGLVLKRIVKQILCINLVKYWDKYTEMHGQQNVRIQGVSKRVLQFWKRIEIYTEDIHNVLNCQNVAKHTEFYLG